MKCWQEKAEDCDRKVERDFKKIDFSHSLSTYSCHEYLDSNPILMFSLLSEGNFMLLSQIEGCVKGKIVKDLDHID